VEGESVEVVEAIGEEASWNFDLGGDNQHQLSSREDDSREAFDGTTDAEGLRTLQWARQSWELRIGASSHFTKDYAVFSAFSKDTLLAKAQKAWSMC
jgi:hypothetical protein